jgi:hypothetical protein
MKVGACGIACEVCGYFVRGMCEGCVAGNDEGAANKLEMQKSKLGFTCPVLECAFKKKIGYCLKDCDKFPCETLYKGFPYSKGFLDIFKKK